MFSCCTYGTPSCEPRLVISSEADGSGVLGSAGARPGGGNRHGVCAGADLLDLMAAEIAQVDHAGCEHEGGDDHEQDHNKQCKGDPVSLHVDIGVGELKHGSPHVAAAA